MTGRIHLIQALCLALVLALTAGIGTAVLVMGGYSVYDEFMDARIVDRYRHWETLAVLADGRVLILEHQRPGRSYLQLNRQPAPAPVDVPALQRTELPESVAMRRPIPRDPRRRVVPLRAGIRPVDWYLLFEDTSPGRAWFEGYSVATGRRAGFIGRGGFSEAPLATDEKFAVDGRALSRRSEHLFVTWNDLQRNLDRYERDERDSVAFDGGHPIARWQVVLLAESGLYRVDLLQRSVQDLVPEAKVLSIGVAGRLEPVPENGRPSETISAAGRFLLRQFLAARTPERVLLMSAADDERTEYVLPERFREQEIDLYLPASGGAIVQSHVKGSSRELGPGRGAYEIELAWITPDGEITREERVTLHHARGISHVGENTAKRLATLAVPAPLISGLFAGVVVPWFEPRDGGATFAASAAESLGETWPALLAVIVLSAVLTWLADRHRRTLGLPRSYAWLAFVFLWGLPGYVGYRLHRRWPLRAPVPPAGRTGSEIFA